MLRASALFLSSFACGVMACVSPPLLEPAMQSEPKTIHKDVAAAIDSPPSEPEAAYVTTGQLDFAAYRQGMAQARDAYGRKDYAGFLASTQKAALAFPHPNALYNLACGHALTGKPQEAIEQLEVLARMSLSFPVMQDDDLASLREIEAFKDLAKRFAALQEVALGKSAPAFKLGEKDFIPEGIAYDSKTGSFFVGSVHKRKIMRVPGKGAPTEFVAKDLDAVLGMAVDEKRRALWACSSAIPEMTGYAEADMGRARVFEFDLDNGKVRRVLALEVKIEKGANHMCNDVTVDDEGHLFVADPGASMVYFLPVGAQSFEAYVPAGKFASPQGMTNSQDKKSLFVADYSRGLFHVDRATREVTWIKPPDNATFLGIDGLTRIGDDLIAIQNGVRPNRVIRIAVDVPTKTTRRVDILQRNHESFDEPTLGIVVGKELFYVANSQWGHFDKGILLHPEKLKEPTILKLSLD